MSRSRNNSSYHRRKGNNHRSRGQRQNKRGSIKSRKGRAYEYDESLFVQKAKPMKNREKYSPDFEFDRLDLDSQLKANIKSKGFETPTPVQNKSVPVIQEGKDVVGIADTGTGKTAAFLIPLLDKVINNRKSNILIVTPTRELANQINDELYALTKNLKIYSVRCIGGRSIKKQIYNINRGFSFIVGTPGRLKDLVDRKVLNLHKFDTVVLDEMDRMLDMGFVHEIKRLIADIPNSRQSLCFSATTNRKVDQIIGEVLKEDYVRISIKSGETTQNVEQDIVRVSGRNNKISKLEELLDRDGFDKVLVFANTRREVDRLGKYFAKNGYKVTSMHGQRSQSSRANSLKRFKSNQARILFATDVASRGLDIDNITHVINYDVPVTYEAYIHRVGRTGRAGSIGTALTFVR